MLSVIPRPRGGAALPLIALEPASRAWRAPWTKSARRPSSSLVLAAWLVAASENAMIYGGFSALLGSLPGKVALFAFSASLVYHFLNGIRHLFWDAGHGFSIPKAYASGYAVLALSVVLTAVMWWFALGGVA